MFSIGGAVTEAASRLGGFRQALTVSSAHPRDTWNLRIAARGLSGLLRMLPQSMPRRRRHCAGLSQASPKEDLLCKQRAQRTETVFRARFIWSVD
jgi:hypothetical protein